MSQMYENLPSSVLSFVEELRIFPDVNKIVLFGSRAVGDFDARADIDLAISAPMMSKRQFARLRLSAYEARTLYWVSLVHLERIPASLRARIDKQGVLLYEQEKNTG